MTPPVAGAPAAPPGRPPADHRLPARRGPGGAEATGERLVAAQLLTRGDGDVGWTDRGRTRVPAHAARGTGGVLQHDAVSYVVEDAFHDGRALTVWARTPRRPLYPSGRRDDTRPPATAG